MKRKRVMWEYETGGFGYACPLDGCQMTMTALSLGDALTVARIHTYRTHDEPDRFPIDYPSGTLIPQPTDASGPESEP